MVWFCCSPIISLLLGLMSYCTSNKLRWRLSAMRGCLVHQMRKRNALAAYPTPSLFPFRHLFQRTIGPADVGGLKLKTSTTQIGTAHIRLQNHLCDSICLRQQIGMDGVAVRFSSIEIIAGKSILAAVYPSELWQHATQAYRLSTDTHTP